MMICEFCGGEAVSKKVRKIHWSQQNLYIVDDVEAEVCQECGERYHRMLRELATSLRATEPEGEAKVDPPRSGRGRPFIMPPSCLGQEG